jgi:hypothetical protein
MSEVTFEHEGTTHTYRDYAAAKAEQRELETQIADLNARSMKLCRLADAISVAVGPKPRDYILQLERPNAQIWRAIVWYYDAQLCASVEDIIESEDQSTVLTYAEERNTITGVRDRDGQIHRPEALSVAETAEAVYARVR